MSLKVTGCYHGKRYQLMRSNRVRFRTLSYGDLVSHGRDGPAFFTRWVTTPSGMTRLALIPLDEAERQRPRHLLGVVTAGRRAAVILEEAREYLWADSAAEAETVGQCIPYTATGHESPVR